METELESIEKAMVTLSKCQSLHDRISKLPNCIYRQSLLEHLEKLLNSHYEATARPSLPYKPSDEKAEWDITVQIKQIRQYLEDDPSWIMNPSHGKQTSDIEWLVKEFFQSVLTISSLIEEGSLSLE